MFKESCLGKFYNVSDIKISAIKVIYSSKSRNAKQLPGKSDT